MSNATNIEEDAIVSRWRFEKEIMALYGGRSKKPEWSKERINVVIRLIEEFDAALETKQLRNSAHYYYAKNYEIVEEGGRKCLVQKRKDINDQPVKIVPLDEYYDVLDEIHRSTGHGGRDKMLMALKYVCFIPTPAVIAFVKSCQTCQRRKAAFKKGPIFLTRAMDAFSKRGLVKLIDMQSMKDERYEWILHYQDCSTKFSLLRPLISDAAAEVASELLKIFLEIGCPAILQIENGREYTADVIKELASLWPCCKILNGKPVPDLTNPGTELIAQLTAWMRDNSSGNWGRGLYFVQFQRNCAYHPCVQQTPYKALFGCDPKVGMDFKCHADILTKICLEEDLECELNRKSASETHHLFIESKSGSGGNPFSKVSEESSNKVPAVLQEHSVKIKTQYITYDPTPSSPIESSSHEPILCTICGDKTVPTHSCDSCHRIMHNTCGISSFESPTSILCPTCHVDSEKIIKTEIDDTTGNETMHEATTEVDIKSEGEYTTTDEPMNDPAPEYEQNPPSPEVSMRQSSSTHEPILCAVCGDKTVSTHSCDSCHRIIHDTCGITSFESPKLILCPTCHIDSVKIIKTEYNDSTGNETMHDATTEVDIKSEGEDTTADEPMNEPGPAYELTPPSPKASMQQSSSTYKPILCAYCGEKTVPTHSCDYCHRIIHETCGITSFESPTLLCPMCHKESLKTTNKRVDLRTLSMKKIDEADALLIERPEVIRQPVMTEWKKTAPVANLERNIKVNKNRLEDPKVLRVKRFGYSTVKCRCKESAKQCSGSRCLCQRKNQACTTNCHNPLECKNLLKVISK